MNSSYLKRRKNEIRGQNDKVQIHSRISKYGDLHGVQTEIPATILFILDIGPTETHTFLLNDQSRINKMNVHGSHCHLL